MLHAGVGQTATAARPSATSIAGGFVLVTVATLMTAWRACRSAPLGIGDFRAWLAAHEIKARRCQLEGGRPPAYSIDELAKLLQVSSRTARASLSRLADAGLLQWSESAIIFPLPAEPPKGLHDSIGGGRGSLALPRRVLRFLVAGSRPALIATVLGVLLRCLSRRRDGFDGRGRLKASWIARVFGVDLSRVKLARAELVQLGWIDPRPSDQWAMNRWGKPYRIDLDWLPPDCRRSLPPRPSPCGQSPPPSLHQEPLREGDQHQEPAGGPSGLSIEGLAGGRNPETVPADPAPTGAGSVPPAPKLADIRVEDLKDTGRLFDLHGQAVAGGLIGTSEADRLRFVAAAEHALAIGKTNPPGLFAYLVRGACWRYITQGDEDRANGRIKAHLRGPALPPMRSGAGPRPARATLSADAETVRRVRAALAAAGYRGDAFPQVRRHDPSWTRERWDGALAELDGVGPASR